MRVVWNDEMKIVILGIFQNLIICEKNDKIDKRNSPSINTKMKINI
jgi:hypothetical protein